MREIEGKGEKKRGIEREREREKAKERDKEKERMLLKCF